jgi:FixJ family two-component response regulator
MQRNFESEAQHAEDGARSVVGRLTPTHRAILSRLLCGESGKSIAVALRMDPADYETQRAVLMRQLNADSTAGAVRIALLAGMGEPRRRTNPD